MAEVHIIGQILKAVNFAEPHVFCKWSLQSGSAWQLIQGEVEGQTFVSANRVEHSSDFAHPLDIHLGTASIQGWPKIHVEVHAVNAVRNTWPVGYGFIHIPSRAGKHLLEILTWKVNPKNFCDSIKDKFGGGGVGLSKADLVFSGVERYKLQTRSSGKVLIEINTILRNFSKFGVEFK